MSAPHTDPLQEELDLFVEFGTLLDRRTRAYLARYLQARLEQRPPDVPDLDETYYRYFCQALDRLFGDLPLGELVLGRPLLSRQVAADVLRWMRQAYRKSQEHNPFADEQQRLGAATVMPLRDFVLRRGVLLAFLSGIYSPLELDTDYYRARFDDLVARRDYADLDADRRGRIERLFHDLLAQWDALLQARLLAYQLEKLEAERDAFQQHLEARVLEFQRLQRLLSPFAEYIGKYWDMSQAQWADASFDLLQRYDELLQAEQAVRELADLLGRMREAEIELEEETIEQRIVRQERIETLPFKAEVDGVHTSADLSYLLSSEASLLGDPTTETLFLKKYTEQSLQALRLEDTERVLSEHHFTEKQQRVRRREKGPFIICIDTSDSMQGHPEQIAKVLCFAILKMATAEGRRAYLINFSVGIKTIDLLDLRNSLDQIVAFLRMSFHGGTDISLAMYEVLRQLQSEAYRDADVLVVSDFVMHRIERDILDQMQHFQQRQGTRFHSLALLDQPNPELIAQFDTNWAYDPGQKGIIRDLAGRLAALGR
ncbi:MAG: ATPase RavA stimulator ViaA [Bacteroidia bacterium]